MKLQKIALKYDVGIVGGGPVGLTLSNLLNHYKVKHFIIDRKVNPVLHPQAHFLNARTMEVIHAYSSKAYQSLIDQIPNSQQWRDFVYCHSVLGSHFYRQDHFKTVTSQFWNSSPSNVGHLAQSKVETTLRIETEKQHYSLFMKGYDVVKCITTSEGSTLDYKGCDIDTENECGQLNCKFLIGADGSNSFVRNMLGIKLLGDESLQHLMNIHFCSPGLKKKLFPRPAMLYFVYNEAMVAVFVAHDVESDEWVCQIPYFPPFQKPEDFDETTVKRMLMAAISGISVDNSTAAFNSQQLQIQIKSIKHWVMNAQVAATYSNNLCSHHNNNRIINSSTNASSNSYESNYSNQLKTEDCSSKVIHGSGGDGENIIKHNANNKNSNNNNNNNNANNKNSNNNNNNNNNTDTNTTHHHHHNSYSNVYLVGDAAHRFPPAGGFGMNTGIQDAYNIAWKLASVIHGSAHSSLIHHTYEIERKQIALENTMLGLRNYALSADTARALGIDPDLAMLAVRSSDSATAKTVLPFAVRRTAVIHALNTGLYTLKWLKDWNKNNNMIGKIRVEALRKLMLEGKGLPLLFPKEDLAYTYKAGALVVPPEGVNGYAQSSSSSFSLLSVGSRIPHCWLFSPTAISATASNTGTTSQANVCNAAFDADVQKLSHDQLKQQQLTKTQATAVSNIISTVHLPSMIDRLQQRHQKQQSLSTTTTTTIEDEDQYDCNGAVVSSAAPSVLILVSDDIIDYVFPATSAVNATLYSPNRFVLVCINDSDNKDKNTSKLNIISAKTDHHQQEHHIQTQLANTLHQMFQEQYQLPRYEPDASNSTVVADVDASRYSVNQNTSIKLENWKQSKEHQHQQQHNNKAVVQYVQVNDLTGKWKSICNTYLNSVATASSNSSKNSSSTTLSSSPSSSSSSVIVIVRPDAHIAHIIVIPKEDLNQSDSNNNGNKNEISQEKRSSYEQLIIKGLEEVATKLHFVETK